MKTLLNKERTLAASPLSYWFLVFTVMTMLPNYPILVGTVFVCLGLFYSFQSTRETNDILYTALLPVRKGDVVRAKYAFCCEIEGIAFGLMAALTAVRMTLLREVEVYAQNAMMNANPVYLAYALLIFMLFNVIFLRDFFKTAYQIGRPLVGFMVASFLLVAAGETLHHIPGLLFLNSMEEGMGIQAAVLAAAILIYVLETRGACSQAVKSFEALDL